MSGDQRPARRHSDEQWNCIRSRFCELYLVENRPLVEARQVLKDELKFEATERQYKRRIKYWGLRKNAKSEDYSRVESLLGTSNTTGVEDIASSTGIPMTNKKIQRYIKSNRRPELESEGEIFSGGDIDKLYNSDTAAYTAFRV
ncbi:hypothetical protein F5883DRAFT_640565 [Diaporthe sp. PMI_573]|nr:hypothetical protein F5883DRAFT_640565 [Diaporthaceae sp. PMI_573]